MHKALMLIPKYNGYLEENHLCDWVASWTAFFPHRTSFLLERMTNRHTMVIQIWMLGRHVLKNEQSVCAIIRKATDIVCCH